jgi:hypothetical protein
MIEILVILAYAATFSLLIGGAVYLFLMREGGGARRTPDSISKETLTLAARVSGAYRLSDLEKILMELGDSGAWGVVVELGLTRVKDIVQMILRVDKVEFYSHNNGTTPNYLERYRRSVEGAGLVVRKVENVEDVFFVEVVGSWSQIASVLRRIVKEIYEVDDHTEVQLAVFQ